MKYFNTSHVSVQARHYRAKGKETIFQYISCISSSLLLLTLFYAPFMISIHLMYQFKCKCLAVFLVDMRISIHLMYQFKCYIYNHVFKNNKISIHLMYQFKSWGQDRPSKSKSISIHLMYQFKTVFQSLQKT